MMRLVKRPPPTDYLTLEDGIFDSRIPARSDEEFRTGIRFTVKLIGVSIISKPRTRNEIITAMRIIRSESRQRKIKKIPVELFVSFDGIRITGKDNFVVITHSLNRIFYVSHDSLDFHVFSLIVRDENIFKCVVFKASKKTLAVNAVRTIGQAFELCQKMNGSAAAAAKSDKTASDKTMMIDSSQIFCRNLKQTDNFTSSKLKSSINIEPIRQQLNSDSNKYDDSNGQKFESKRKPSNTSSMLTDEQNVQDEIDLGKSELRSLLSTVTGKLDDMTERIRVLEQQITRLSAVLQSRDSDDKQLLVSLNDHHHKIHHTQSDHYVFDNSIENEHNDNSDIDNRLNEKLAPQNNVFNDKLSYLVPESILTTPTPILPASKHLYLGELY